MVLNGLSQSYVMWDNFFAAQEAYKSPFVFMTCKSGNHSCRASRSASSTNDRWENSFPITAFLRKCVPLNIEWSCLLLSSRQTLTVRKPHELDVVRGVRKRLPHPREMLGKSIGKHRRDCVGGLEPATYGFNYGRLLRLTPGISPRWCPFHGEESSKQLLVGARGLSFNLGQKIYENCTKCNLVQATPDHLLFCAGLEREDIYSSPFWCTVWAHGARWLDRRN
ncbi:hypothetical protein TNCV_863641 [Trichonephila clavipes]|nr:hypothetical protein TNCV_863641 [Trichonephila clavipes]